MSEERFTKENTDRVGESVGRIFKAVSKGKQFDLLGDLNDVFLYLSAAKTHAPSE